MTKRAMGRTILGLFLAGFLFMSLAGQAAAKDFYEGKTIRIIVCCSPGGFYDRWARLFARYMGKYIPGKPEIIVQNMPGAGGLIATNYVYKVAKQDGTAIVSPLGGQYLDQVAGRKEVLFDFGKFQWLGTQEISHSVLFCRKDSKFQSVDDLVKIKDNPAKLGNTGTSGSSYFIGKVLEKAAGANFNFVMGYPGGSEIDLAVERGEVACRGMTIPPHFGREPYLTWHKTNFITQLVQTGSERDSRMKDVPTLTEVMDKYKTSDDVRAIAKVIFASGDFGRPLGVGPGVPADRVKMLRTAYLKALADPELMAEAEKGRMTPVIPSSGEKVQELAKFVSNQPKEVVDGVRGILGR